MKIHSKKELQDITTHGSADIDYKYVMKIYRKSTSESYYFLAIDNTLPADSSLKFRKYLLNSL